MTDMELRCQSKLLGILIIPADGGIVELKCSSRFCGARSGTVVLHRFSTGNGVLVETKRYKDTPKMKGK
jgi:hypothetical protein